MEVAPKKGRESSHQVGGLRGHHIINSPYINIIGNIGLSMRQKYILFCPKLFSNMYDTNLVGWEK
jgi:hypothetical protein